MTITGGGWESLDPFEKIVQWREVAPEISDEVLRLAKARAVQTHRAELRLEKERVEAARFERELLRTQERNRFKLEQDRQVEQYKLANRMWWMQLVGTVGGLLLIAGLILSQVLLSGANDVGRAVAILGIGGTLTAGVYGLNTATRKALQTLTANEANAPKGATSQSSVENIEN